MGKKPQVSNLVDSSDNKEALLKKHLRRKTKGADHNAAVKQVPRLVDYNDSSDGEGSLMKKSQKAKVALRGVFA